MPRWRKPSSLQHRWLVRVHQKKWPKYLFFSHLNKASYVTGALWLADDGVTVAKGAVGEDTPKDLRSELPGELRLDHSLEGLKNKRTHAIKK